MKRIEVSHPDIPLITFDSGKWKEDHEHEDTAVEIIKFIKEHKYDGYFIQNKSYSFGDTMTHPIIMVNRNDHGGLDGSLEDFIRDVIYDLMPKGL